MTYLEKRIAKLAKKIGYTASKSEIYEIACNYTKSKQNSLSYEVAYYFG